MTKYNLDFWDSKSILITRVCGTIGKELLKHLSSLPIKKIVGLDNNENEIFFLNQEFGDNQRINLYICDIRNKNNMSLFFKGIDIVLHVASLKHVIINEYNPSEAISTNILGTQNVIECSREKGVKKVIFTSSDKAVNPNNVMGTSKLMAERLITAANFHESEINHTIFSSTRFGNVLGSNGSVIPIFKKQLECGKSLTITDKKMIDL